MIRPAALFFLPNTTTLLARTAIQLIREASQDQLDEAIQTLVNRSLPAEGVMRFLEQNVHIAEVLQKLAAEWLDETVRVFATALRMDPAKIGVMDLIVAIAILNEPDLEAELRSENTTDATPTELLENRRITWQYPPPGTPLTPPYVMLVAVEQLDTSVADSQVQAILGELVEYRGYKIGRRAPGGVRPLPPFVTTRFPLADFDAPLLDPRAVRTTLIEPGATAEQPAVPSAEPSLATGPSFAEATGGLPADVRTIFNPGSAGTAAPEARSSGTAAGGRSTAGSAGATRMRVSDVVSRSSRVGRLLR